MDKCLIGHTFLVLYCLISAASSRRPRCIEAGPTEVNTTHPSVLNRTDTEQLANLTSFCPVGKLGVSCVDEKNETMGTFRNTSIYIATCEPIKGLWCRPYGKEQCPDFSAFYTCTCNSKSTTPAHKTDSTVLTNPTILIGGTGDGSRTTIAAMAAHSPTQRLSLNLSTRNRRHTGNSGVVNGYNINLVVTLVVVYFSM